jgi:hypothetical protein
MSATFDPIDLEERAFKASLTLDAAAQTQFLLDSVGARVTAAAVGLADARPLYRWRDGGQQKEHLPADRLRVLFRIGYEIHHAYGPRVLSAFLRSSNPQLGDRAPLAVLADNNPAEVEGELLAATRAFLEG